MKKITFEDRVPVGISDKIVLINIVKLIYKNHFNGDRVDNLREYCVDASTSHHFNSNLCRPMSVTEAVSEFIWEFSNGLG